MNLKVAILDSHTMFTQIMAHYIHTLSDMTVAIECKEASQLLDYLETNPIDLLFLELSISDKDGIDVISGLRRIYPKIKILVISKYRDSKFVRKAMILGADAYLYKGNDVSEIERAIASVMEGNTYLGPGVRTSPSSRLNSLKENTKASEDAYVLKKRLTKREKEILSNIAKGKNNREIGKELFISFQTVGVHRKNIMKKLGVRNTTGLIKAVLEKQLV